MGSHRRIVFYLFGGLVFLLGYSVYAAFLGAYDGLPPLPDELLREPDPDDVIIPPSTSNPTDSRLREAFGPKCVETDYTIKIEFRAKGLVLAAGEFIIEPDGRVQLTPFSLALFGKPKNNQTEINTIHCDRAYLTFDRPVKNVTEMGNRKIVAAELLSDGEIPSDDPRLGKIFVTNNRKTPAIEDDIRLMTPGPIHYRDEPKRDVPDAPFPPHIWTTAVVEMIDLANSPVPVTEATLRMPRTRPAELREPSTLAELRAGKRGPLPTATADGLKLFLALEPPAGAKPAPAPPPGTPKRNPGAITGVEKVELTANVQMNLWIDARSNFFNGAAPKQADPKATPAPAAPPTPEKVLVQIETSGHFHYDMVSDKARFDIAPRIDPSLPNHVLVTRHLQPNVHDLLACDSLEMQFRRQKGEAKPRPDAPAGSAPAAQENIQIDSVHAWGKTVAVSSDSEQLQAWGNDLVYDALAKQTTFQGDKLVVLKDGNLIEAYQLIMAGLDTKDQQQARVKGPGRIGLGTLDPKTKSHARQAHWKDWLIYGKEKQKEQIVDVLTLTGGAMFVDAQNGQSLAGRELKLWLVEAAKKDAKSPGEGRKPQRLQATGAVVAHSLELEIERAEHLNVWFKDVPPKAAPVANGMPPINIAPPQAIPAQPMPVVADPMRREPMKDANPPKPTPKRDPLAAKPRDPNKKPIRIIARQIETWVVRDGDRSELERAHCDGRVSVKQDPTENNEKGVDITGNTLVLDHFTEGNVMVVHGTVQDRARVFFDKLALVGPEITIDQRNNMALVKGAGSMKLKSSTDLEGKKLQKETDIDIAWSEGMEFRGAEKWARFGGGVQAMQLNARVLCQTMQVTLDREVWLNQDQKPKNGAGGNESPKVEFVVCDHQPREGQTAGLDLPELVTFSDLSRDPLGKVVKLQKVEARELNLDNPRGRMIAPGPGSVRIFQPGSKDVVDGNDNKGPKKKDDTELKLTIVNYKGRMTAVKSRDNAKRMATFLDNIEVIHVSSDDPYAIVDVAKLPENGMHLRCDESLEVYASQTPDGRGNQEMIAKGNAVVRSLRQGQEFVGRSETVKFDESKDLITFEGTRENPATLYRVKVQGQRPEVFKGEKILYYRKSNNFDVINGSGGSSN